MEMNLPKKKKKNLPILTRTLNVQKSSDGKKSVPDFCYINLCDVQHAKMVFYLSNACYSSFPNESVTPVFLGQLKCKVKTASIHRHDKLFDMIRAEQ